MRKKLLLGLLVLLMGIMIPKVESQASELDFSLAFEDGDTSSASMYKNGCSYLKTGFMCMVVDKDGNRVSEDAKLISSYANNFPSRTTSTWMVKSRVGNYTCSSINGTNIQFGSPFNSDGTSNGASIREWLAGSTCDASMSNCGYLINQYFGQSVYDRWLDDEDVYLVLEPVMSFQPYYKFTFNIPNSALDGKTYAISLGKQVVGTAETLSSYMVKLYNSYNSPKFQLEFPINSVMSRYVYDILPNTIQLSNTVVGINKPEITSGKIHSSVISEYGYGVMCVSASSLGLVIPTEVVEEKKASGTYEGYIMSLSCTGNSGSYSQNALLRGLLECGTSAAGTDAQRLSESLSPGLSYGSSALAPIVYSGSGIELSVESNVNIRAGLMQVDASTFYGLNSVINTSNQAEYQSFTNEIKNNLCAEINLLQKDGSTLKDSYSYDTRSYVGSGVQGGDFKSTSAKIPVYTTSLTQSNCQTTGNAPDWLLGLNYSVVCNNFYQIYYNSASNDVELGKSLLESTDIFRALEDSTKLYEDDVKANGVLLAYWNDKMNADRESKSSTAGNSAVTTWKASNPVPVSVESPADLNLSVTDAGYDSALALYNAYLSEKEVWKKAKTAIYDAKYNSTYTAYNESVYTCGYTSPQQWNFEFYTCDPFYEAQYMLTDKIPLNAGPSASPGKYFQRGYGASFVYSTNTSYSGDTSHLITFLPFVSGATVSTIGGVSDISRLVDSIHIMQADFIIPDMTTANMKN